MRRHRPMAGLEGRSWVPQGGLIGGGQRRHPERQHPAVARRVLHSHQKQKPYWLTPLARIGPAHFSISLFTRRSR